MHSSLKITLGLIFSLVVVVGSGVAYLITAFPQVGPADAALKIDPTPERLERGSYLANHLAGCVSCHSPRVMDTRGFMPKPGMEFTGIEFSALVEGMPGKIFAPNLTRLQDHTDGELYRAIAEGVNRQGRAMFPMMPYLALGTVDKEDVYSIIAYIRSLPPTGEVQPNSEIAMPEKLIFRTIPTAAQHKPKPTEAATPQERGEYLVRLGGCMDCHTPIDDQHQMIPGMVGAGGQEFPLLSDGVKVKIRTANITPDLDTGIGSWTKETFISTLRERANDQIAREHVAFGEPNSIMGYWEYAGLSDADLQDMFAYLQSLKPVDNRVVRFERN